MQEIRLSNDADALLCVLYKTYLDRRSSGTSKADARFFPSSEYIHKNLMTKWSFQDVNETCWELYNNGMLNCLPGDDEVLLATLSDQAIVYLENRFKDGASALLQHLGALASLIPW